MKLRLTLLVLASTLVLRAADAPPLFNATLTLGKEHRFVLVGDNGRASEFLGLGESFGGYTIRSYDAKAGALELERDGKISRVHLVPDAATKPAAPSENRRVLQTLAAMINPAGMVRVGGNTRLMIGGKSVPVGTKFTAKYNDQDYELELAAVDQTTFTLRFRGEEVSRPIRPAAPGR